MKSPVIRAFRDLRVYMRCAKIVKISLHGKQVQRAVLIVSVVRLDVIAPRVVRLDVSVREWSG